MSVDSVRMEKLRSRPFDGQALKHMVEAGLTWLKTNQQTVNSLNVFPVPDGDTGTNMTLTMISAWNEVKNSGEKHAGKMAALVAQGALMGARGQFGRDPFTAVARICTRPARQRADRRALDGQSPGRSARYRL